MKIWLESTNENRALIYKEILEILVNSNNNKLKSSLCNLAININ